jgi:hypothetical protein
VHQGFKGVDKRFDKAEEEMREGFEGMSNSMGWIDKRLVRLEETLAIGPMGSSL